MFVWGSGVECVEHVQVQGKVRMVEHLYVQRFVVSPEQKIFNTINMSSWGYLFIIDIEVVWVFNTKYVWEWRRVQEKFLEQPLDVYVAIIVITTRHISLLQV